MRAGAPNQASLRPEKGAEHVSFLIEKIRNKNGNDKRADEKFLFFINPVIYMTYVLYGTLDE